ncbi:MFS transporter [Brevibacterium spongiae]|uniref:MFS transporter n=1 Tax=Brevibacterium spongiae TaxID=2909672 RepID=A0ABY5SU50_9MICO|nr:MFS transporter [Brevibacterium spongiae]UVI36631.1 MFS transporter [Brevibacterium spongiae]
MTTVTSAWTVPSFRLFWSAGALSRLGAEVGEIALPALTLITLGATAMEASWVRTALVAPFLAVTLWFGVVVDRRPRRPLMILADWVRGILLAAVCVLALTNTLTIPVAVGAAFAIGTMTVLYQLADFSFLPQFVPEDALVDANSKITATESAIETAGSGVGGLIVQAVTAPVAIAVNAVGYLASALLIGRLRVTEPPPEPATAETADRPAASPSTVAERSAIAEARDGLKVLIRHPILRALAAEASLWNFGHEILMLALAVQMLAGLPAGPLIFGAVVTCGGIGALVGSLLSPRLTRRFGYGRSLLVSLIVGNTAPLIGMVIVAFIPAVLVPGLAVAFLLSGLGSGVADSQSTSIRQLALPAEFRGRVNAGYRLVSWGALSIGAILGGTLITLIGPVGAAVSGAALMALATVPVALSPVRGIRAINEVAADRLGED